MTVRPKQLGCIATRRNPDGDETVAKGSLYKWQDMGGSIDTARECACRHPSEGLMQTQLYLPFAHVF
jgi:hypothetical protein